MLRKNARAIIRLIVSIFLLWLPIITEGFSAETLMLAVIGLFAVLLVWATAGGLVVDVCWMEPWGCHRFPPGEDEEEKEFLVRHNSHIEV